MRRENSRDMSRKIGTAALGHQSCNLDKMTAQLHISLVPRPDRNTPLEVEDVHWKCPPLDSKDHTGVFAGVTGIILIKEIPEFLH